MSRPEMIYTRGLESKQTEIVPLLCGASRETSPLLPLSEWPRRKQTQTASSAVWLFAPRRHGSAHSNFKKVLSLMHTLPVIPSFHYHPFIFSLLAITRCACVIIYLNVALFHRGVCAVG